MTLGIECLLCDDADSAMEMAAALDKLNHERREILQQMQNSVAMHIPELEGENIPYGLCLYNEEWHQGVVGVLASRVREACHRPVIVFADDGADRIKGSGRSIAALHLRDTLDNIATRNPGLIKTFGGHAMAAGVVIDRVDLDRFREQFDVELQRRLSVDDLHGVMHSDGELESGDIGLALAESIRSGGPWGSGFPEPAFDGKFTLCERRILADSHLKMTVTLPGSGRKFDAIAFQTRDDDWPDDTSHVHLVYRLEINEYNGRRKEQLVVEYVEPMVI